MFLKLKVGGRWKNREMGIIRNSIKERTAVSLHVHGKRRTKVENKIEMPMVVSVCLFTNSMNWSSHYCCKLAPQSHSCLSPRHTKTRLDTCDRPSTTNSFVVLALILEVTIFAFVFVNGDSRISIAFLVSSFRNVYKQELLAKPSISAQMRLSLMISYGSMVYDIYLYTLSLHFRLMNVADLGWCWIPQSGDRGQIVYRPQPYNAVYYCFCIKTAVWNLMVMYRSTVMSENP